MLSSNSSLLRPAALVLMSAVLGCQGYRAQKSLVGNWKVEGVEKGGMLIPVTDKVALSKIPGAAQLSRQGFEMTSKGDYISGGNRARWRAVKEGEFAVAYPIHGKEVELKVQYLIKGGNLKIRRPDGDFWIVLSRAQ